MNRDALKTIAGALRTAWGDYKRARQELRALLGRVEPPGVVAYAGFATRFDDSAGMRLQFGGRVLEQGGLIDHSPEPGTSWQNLRAMLRRFRSDEIPDARVRATLGRNRWEARTDNEGYFSFHVDLEEPLEAGWHEIPIEVVESLAGRGGRPDRARILVPPEHPDFAIVSDIDDTLIETHAADRLQMLRTVFLHDAHTRSPFPGVSRLYRALVAGPDGRGHNPIFYLSRSPWNLYDLFTTVFEVHGIPPGPLFLRDFALIEAASRTLGREHHKLTWLRRLLAAYPRLPFLLFGDSGQQDPEIYEQIALENPGRVKAILIRDVTTPRRDRQVRALARAVGTEGVPMFLGGTTTELAARLASLGLIAPEHVEHVERRREVVEAEAASAP